jgi:hypothetical protein
LPAGDILDTAGSRLRDIGTAGRFEASSQLHDALSSAQAESSTMRWRKKLYDALAYRSNLNEKFYEEFNAYSPI